MKTFDSVNIGGAVVVILLLMFVMLQKADKTEDISNPPLSLEKIETPYDQHEVIRP